MLIVLGGVPPVRALHPLSPTALHRYAVTAIEWALVPMILFGFFIYGMLLTPSDRSLRTSAAAGKLTGLILFVLFVLTRKARPLPSSFSLPNYDVQRWPFLVSMALLFVLFGVVDRLLRTRVVSIVAMLLVFGSLITAYVYIFIPSYRPTIIYIVLGSLLGALLETLLLGRDPAKRAAY